MEVSAKTGDNINESFVNLTKQILQKRTENDPGVDIASGVNLTDRKGIEKKKCECWLMIFLNKNTHHQFCLDKSDESK